MRSRDEIKGIVAGILGDRMCSGEAYVVDPSYSGSDRVEIRVERDVAITFDDLLALSTAFDTRLIDIEFERETGAYSDVTPGDPSRFRIIIRGVD